MSKLKRNKGFRRDWNNTPIMEQHDFLRDTAHKIQQKYPDHTQAEARDATVRMATDMYGEGFMWTSTPFGFACGKDSAKLSATLESLFGGAQ